VRQSLRLRWLGAHQPNPDLSGAKAVKDHAQREFADFDHIQRRRAEGTGQLPPICVINDDAPTGSYSGIITVTLATQ